MEMDDKFKVLSKGGEILEFDLEKLKDLIKSKFEELSEGELKSLSEGVLEKLADRVSGGGVIEEEKLEELVNEVASSHGYGFDDIKDDVGLTDSAMRVLKARYLMKDENGRIIETPKKMFRRVARAIAEVERLHDPKADLKKYEDMFYEIMASLDFIPNSPCLMNAGTELGQLSACFVIPVEDSIDSIFDAVKAAALIHKSGGGCIAKGSKVYTTFCGVENIENVYE